MKEWVIKWRDSKHKENTGKGKKEKGSGSKGSQNL